jgi:hypothetical protein
MTDETVSYSEIFLQYNIGIQINGGKEGRKRLRDKITTVKCQRAFSFNVQRKENYISEILLKHECHAEALAFMRVRYLTHGSASTLLRIMWV